MDKLLRPREAAQILGVAVSTSYKMAANGLLPSVRWAVENNGRRKELVRFRESDLLNFIESHSKPLSNE
jgi:excisionase family DNA binding protein